MAQKHALLVVDVGNTSVSAALYVNGKTTRFTRIDHSVTREADIKSLLAGMADGYIADGAVLCSVVPAKNRLWSRALKTETGQVPLVVTCDLDFGIPIN